MKDYGFENGWTKVPDEVATCRNLKHKTMEINLDKTMRGLDHLVTCQDCQITYHYDSSD